MTQTLRITPGDPVLLPRITDHPDDVTVAEGGDATWNVFAVGESPLTYQWKEDGVNIPGATSTSYTKNDVTLADDDKGYSALITNAHGTALSFEGKLIVVGTGTLAPRPRSALLCGHTADIAGVHAPATLQTPVSISGRSSYNTTTGDLTLTGPNPNDPDGVWRNLLVPRYLNIRYATAHVYDSRVVRSVTVATKTDATTRSYRAILKWLTIGVTSGHETIYLNEGSSALNDCIRAGGFEAYRCNLFGMIDGVKFNVPNLGGTIDESWIHDLYQREVDSGQGGTPSHNDCVQAVSYCKGVYVYRSVLDCWHFRHPDTAETRLVASSDPDDWFPQYRPQTSAFMFVNGSTEGMDDIIAQYNLFDGDVYKYMYFTRANSTWPCPTNVQILDNIWTQRYAKYGKDGLVGSEQPGNITWDMGNVNELGQHAPSGIATVNIP